MKYLITGVDGQLSRRVAELILKRIPGENLIFTAPKLDSISNDKKQEWLSKGVTLKEADYDNLEQLTKTFNNVDKLFFISSILNGEKRVKQHKNVITACVNANVKYILYTSFLGADNLEYDQYVLPDHRKTEDMIRKSGISYNIVRNNLYMENYLVTSIILAMLSNNIWGTSAGDGKVSAISKDDSAECIVALLLGKGKINNAYNLTSDVAISQKEICEFISKKSGIKFIYTPLSKEDFLIYLENLHIPKTTDGDFSKSPVPFCSNDMITNEWAINKGIMGVISEDVEKLLNRKPTSFKSLVDKYEYVWKNKIKSLKELS